jgi:hypothetical protein
MVICDDLQRREEEPGVYDLVGVRTELLAPSFPHVQDLLCVYAQATGHEGTASCQLNIIRAEDDALVHASSEREVEFTGPLVVIPLSWRINYCRFEEPGLYYVQLYFGSRLANERFFTVVQAEGWNNGGAEET